MPNHQAQIESASNTITGSSAPRTSTSSMGKVMAAGGQAVAGSGPVTDTVRPTVPPGKVTKKEDMR